ncbi:hypothetical protein [Serratia fonticola]|uniref:hypothetical protein n=1 Tax=Serratia fonticola TaxID=47917 RepID=UPI0021B7EB77|nr:hypothetical protein [Serratia fonticola]
MTSTQLQIISTVIGFLGTLIMFFNGYNLKPYEGAVFGSDAVNEANKKITRDNKRIMVMQKIGMGLLTFSFLCQAVSYLLD